MKPKPPRPKELKCACGTVYPVNPLGVIPTQCHACRPARNNRQAEYYHRTKSKPKPKICTACKSNPVHKGLRFLCIACYKYNSEPGHQPAMPSVAAGNMPGLARG